MAAVGDRLIDPSVAQFLRTPEAQYKELEALIVRADEIYFNGEKRIQGLFNDVDTISAKQLIDIYAVRFFAAAEKDRIINGSREKEGWASTALIIAGIGGATLSKNPTVVATAPWVFVVGFFCALFTMVGPKRIFLCADENKAHFATALKVMDIIGRYPGKNREAAPATFKAWWVMAMQDYSSEVRRSAEG